MFTITINAKTPEEFKEAVKSLYALFPDNKVKPKSETKASTPTEASASTQAASINPADTKSTNITIETLRAAVQEKATAKEENKALIRSLLSNFGATSVTTLAAEHYPDFLTKVKAIA